MFIIITEVVKSQQYIEGYIVYYSLSVFTSDNPLQWLIINSIPVVYYSSGKKYKVLEWIVFSKGVIITTVISYQ